MLSPWTQGTWSTRRISSPWARLTGTQSTGHRRERHVFGAARCPFEFYFKNDDKECVLLSLVAPSRAEGSSPSAGTELWEPVQLPGSSPEALGIPELPVPPGSPSRPFWSGQERGKRLRQSGERARRAGHRRRAAWCIQTPKLLGLKISPAFRHERLHGQGFHENPCSKPLCPAVVLRTNARPARGH